MWGWSVLMAGRIFGMSVTAMGDRIDFRTRLVAACRGWVGIVLLLLIGSVGTVWGEEGLPLLAPLSAGDVVELPELEAAVPSPAQVLGYPLGTRFTRYAEIRGYLERLAAGSERVRVWDYGSTYLGRPLTLVAVSSAANLARLEAIREERGRLADPSGLSGEARESLAETAPLVVWLAYGVHGNESSSAEAAMATAYVLAAAGGEWAKRLEDVVVLIDPLSNPDGRERYVTGYQERAGREPDADPASAEHVEPWPGGRYNHYLIDLNRDWTWASQRETRFRLAAIRTWQPQVFVDLHEMSSDATYFFPPSADPVNPEIDPRVVSWLDVFGHANAAAFDRQGWLYYKRESFDLFYPGYADSYASFLGAVGMTYEVAGGGRAGLAVRLDDGSVLTLADRIARHLTASLATVETAATHHRRLLGDFLDSRLDNARRADAPTYLWPADRPESTALATLLARHGIAVHRLLSAVEMPARPLAPRHGDGRPQPHRFAAGAWVVPSAQPLGNLARALLEPETPMSQSFVDEQRQRVEQDLDAGFYDVTAWSLPLAFNVEAWRTDAAPAPLGPALAPPTEAERDGDVPPAEAASAAVHDEGTVRGEGNVGWLLAPSGLATYRAAARLQTAGVPYRLALGDLTVGGRTYAAGTLFVPRRAAPPATEALLAGLAADGGFTIDRVGTSYSDDGLSLGSARMVSIAPARIALVFGDGVQPTSLGSLWHLLDRQAEVPVTLLDLAELSGADLADFDVLVLPDGWGYGDALAGDDGDAVERWVKAGGVLVAVGDAIGWLRERGLTQVEEWSPQETPDLGAEDPESPSGRGSSGPLDRPLYVPGAVVATEMRQGHPLTVGIASPPPTLISGTKPLLATGQPQVDVLTVAHEEPVMAGLAWPESQERLAGSLLVGSEAAGKGRVVLFAQEPGFRLFWRGTMPLFLNAVMFGPSVGDGGGR